MADVSLEADILMRSVRSAVTGRPDEDLARLAVGLDDAAGVFELARRNKLGVLAAAGLKLSLEVLPPAFRAAADAYGAATMRKNAANLMTIRRVAPLLEGEGIDVVLFKGPVQQQLLYGNYFTKPAGDVDLLVAPADYDRAARTLLAHGYSLPRQCATPWWRHFLGEQPFISDDHSLLIIDLHHKTQQPGCPSPRRPAAFLQEKARVAVGGVMVPTLSRAMAALLACMNLAKAMCHREHAAGYAADIAAFLHKASPAESAHLAHSAEEQGLRNTLALGLRCVEALIGVETPLRSWRLGDSPFASTPNEELVRMALLARPEGIGWSKRRRLLWELCDSPGDYPRELSWAVGGEVFRRVYENRSPSAPPAQRSVGFAA